MYCVVYFDVAEATAFCYFTYMYLEHSLPKHYYLLIQIITSKTYLTQEISLQACFEATP